MPRKLKSCHVCQAPCRGKSCRLHCQSNAPRGPYKPRETRHFDRNTELMKHLVRPSYQPKTSWWLSKSREEFAVEAERQYRDRLAHGTGVNYTARESV
jgi:hypothetical protein